MSIERKTAIVLIDIQGKLAEIMHDSESLFYNVEILIKGANLLKIPIIWTEQLPDKLGTTIKRISKLFSNQKPIIKSEFSCVRNNDFSNHIEKEKYNHFLVCGI